MNTARRHAQKKTVVILAGGRGTRLAPLTDSVPKALVTVGGLPLVRYAITWARELGATKIIVSGSYQFDVLQRAVTELDPTVSVIRDKVIDPGKRILGVVSVQEEVEGDVIFYDGDYIYHRSVAEAMKKRDFTDLTVHATPQKSKYMAQDVVVKTDNQNHFLGMWKTKGTVELGPNEYYFNSLLYCPFSHTSLFFKIAQEIYTLPGIASLEDIVVEFKKCSGSVSVALLPEPLWVEVDNHEERAAGERFVNDYKGAIPL